MNLLGRLASLLLISVTLASYAHAADRPKTGEKVIDLGDGCQFVLDPAKKPGQSLAPVKVDKQLEGTVFEKIVNGPREIATARYSRIYTENREKQVEAARALAQDIAKGVFDLIGDPENGDRIQQFIMTRLGQIPEEALQTLRNILEGESLAKLNTNRTEKSISDRTDNALADIAKALSTFREKTGDKTVDVNTAANLLDKIAKVLPFRGVFGKAGQHVRENYQDAVQVIDLNKAVLTEGITYQTHLQEQYRFARQESVYLQAYIDMSLIVTEELKTIFDDSIAQSELDENQLAWVQKVIIQPIVTVRATLRDASLTNMGGYLTLGQLMDRNLSVIQGLYYTRTSSALKITIGAAAKHGIKKLDDKIDLMENLNQIGNQIQRENVAGLAKLADRTKEMMQKQITNQEEAVELAGLLISTIENIRKSENELLPIADKVDAIVKRKTEELQRKGMALEAIDKIRLVDGALKEVTGRSPNEAASAPLEPTLTLPAN